MAVKVLTESQLRSLVEAPDARSWRGKRDRALIAVMGYAGLRIAEATSLTRENITQEGSRIRLTFAGKGGKQRTVSLPSTAAQALFAQLSTHTSSFAFPGAGGRSGAVTGHLSTRQARDIIEGYGQEIGLPSWFHPHSLRHSFASTVQRKLGDLHLTQSVLGHSSPATTARYYLAFDPRYADKAAAVFE